MSGANVNGDALFGIVYEYVIFGNGKWKREDGRAGVNTGVDSESIAYSGRDGRGEGREEVSRTRRRFGLPFLSSLSSRTRSGFGAGGGLIGCAGRLCSCTFGGGQGRRTSRRMVMMMGWALLGSQCGKLMEEKV